MPSFVVWTLLAASQVSQIVSSSTVATSTAASGARLEASGAGEEDELESFGGDALLDVEIHAFVSQGAFISTGNNYLGHSTRGSVELTDVGINFTKRVTEDLRLGLQLFTRDLGPIGNYTAKLDWFYLDYRWTNWLGFRAGRVKLPFGLYNEISDADSARLPILLPQSVYPIENRDFLLAQTGFEIYGFGRLGAVGDFDYQLYFGTIFLETPSSVSAAGVVGTAVETPYVVGGRLLWSTPIPGLRAGGSVQALQLDFDFILAPELIAAFEMAGRLPADFANPLHAELPAVLAVGSLEYSRGDFLFAAEYSRWITRIDSAYPGVFPPAETTSERFYGMTSYRFSRLFEAGVYYAVSFPDVENRKTRSQSRQDWAATLRFDLASFWLLKLEAHYLRGTAGLNPALNSGKQPSEMELDWALFLARTTLYF